MSEATCDAALCVLSCIVGVHGREREVRSARFLLSLDLLDTLCWGVGRTVVFEVLLMASKIYGHRGFLLASVSMTTLEVVCEFAAAACTVRLFKRLRPGATLSASNLALFSLDSYGVSSALALALYPLVGLLAYLRVGSDGFVLACAAVVQNAQYGFGNQVGDQSVSMSRPHWLETFRPVTLSFPARFPRAAVTTARPTAESLAVYLSLFGPASSAHDDVREM